MKPRIAVSIGDINGIGAALLLQNHDKVCSEFEPLYIVDSELLASAAHELKLPLPHHLTTISPQAPLPSISPGKIEKQSGSYSFASFKHGLDMCDNHECSGIVTLPIHKKSWELAGLNYSGHTDYLRKRYNKEAIMMLGSHELYVALFTEHIPLKEVASRLTFDDFYNFLITLDNELPCKEQIGVLGLNPHAGDFGVLGDEEEIIISAIKKANNRLSKNRFSGPLVPDTAFTPHSIKKYNYLVAIYHDQGLAPLKALYFDQSINVSLNLPIKRSSVDHGTAFDIAYKENIRPNATSYLNAFRYHKA